MPRYSSKTIVKRQLDQVWQSLDRYVARASVFTQRGQTDQDQLEGLLVRVQIGGTNTSDVEQTARTSVDQAGCPHEPSLPACSRDEDEPVRHAVRTYAALQPELHAVTDRYVAIITTLLDDAGINYLSITGRTKSVASFAAKAVRSLNGEPLYDDPLTQITDVVGVRVITYLQSESPRSRNCSPTS